MRKFKMQDFKCKIMMALLFTFLIVNLVFAEKASAFLTARVNPNHVKIDFFYHGCTITVNGFTDPGDIDLIVKITSPLGQEMFRKRVKAAGFLWMEKGELTFDHVPALYKLYSTGKSDDVLTQEEMDKYSIGYHSLHEQVAITPVADKHEKTQLFDEFVKLKESSGVYSVSYGAISKIVEQGKQRYSLEIAWPYTATPDTYLVTVYAVKNKRVIGKTETNILVEQVGLLRVILNMATNNGALYGILAIVAALIAGFTVGIVFKRGKGGH
jgi:uncharacterized protein (TIGR02186 family)